MLDVIWHGLRDALLMTWQVWWALALGFAISAVVQVRAPRERVQAALGGRGARPVGLATLLGAASSSCSYAAVAIGRSLLARGASAAASLAFQFASTNLVWELGLVLWALIGWQFAAAEYLGGLVMIALMSAGLRLFVSATLEQEARTHAQAAEASHDHHHHHADAGAQSSLQAIGGAFVSDVSMLYREIGIGLLLSAFAAQLPNSFYRALFLRHGPDALRAVENAIVGPLIAIASFVCSVGNVPLAAVLWSGGISFAGVLAFLFADLVVLPILVAYRRLYGAAYALRITLLMLITMVLAALTVSGLFGAIGLIPGGHRPARADIFAGISVDHVLVLNVLSTILAVALIVVSRSGRRVSEMVHNPVT